MATVLVRRDDVDKMLAMWEAHYRKMAVKPGDSLADVARWTLCEYLRRELKTILPAKRRSKPETKGRSKMNRIYRQGDVAIIRIDDMDTSKLKPVPRDAGRIVLAYGEVTGHAHAIPSEFASLYLEESTVAAPDVGNMISRIGGGLIPDRILRADRPVALLHEEHSRIDLPAGSYRVRIQREYAAGELKNVAD